MITKIQIEAVNEMCKLSEELNMSVNMNKIVSVINSIDSIEDAEDYYIVSNHILNTANSIAKDRHRFIPILAEQIACAISADIWGNFEEKYIEFSKLQYICKMLS